MSADRICCVDINNVIRFDHFSCFLRYLSKDNDIFINETVYYSSYIITKWYLDNSVIIDIWLFSKVIENNNHNNLNILNLLTAKYGMKEEI